MSDSLRPQITARQASLSITNSQSLLKLMSIELVMPSSHLILCRPLLLLQSLPASESSNESTLRIRWPKYWSFSFSIRPSNEHPGLISFRMDWLDLLAFQGLSWVFSNTIVQKHQRKLSFLHSPILTSIHDHWKNHSLDKMDLCWQSISRLVITFLPRSKHLLISWLQSPSACFRPLSKDHFCVLSNFEWQKLHLHALNAGGALGCDKGVFFHDINHDINSCPFLKFQLYNSNFNHYF